MLTRQSLLLCWGITVAVAYLLTQYFGHTLEHGHAAVLWTWGIAMALPVLLTVLLGGRANTLVWVWAIMTVLAMLENVWVHATHNKALMPLSYHALWFAFGAACFGYTAAVVDGGPRRRLYAVAAALHAGGLVVTLLDQDLMKGYEYVVLALIQDGPMLLDAPLRQKQEHTPA